MAVTNNSDTRTSQDIADSTGLDQRRDNIIADRGSITACGISETNALAFKTFGINMISTSARSAYEPNLSVG